MNNQDSSLKISILELYQNIPNTLHMLPQKNADFPRMIATLGKAYSAYFLGLMSADESFEIYTVQKQLEFERLNDVINQNIVKYQIKGSRLQNLKRFQAKLKAGKVLTLSPEELISMSIVPDDVEACSVSLHDAVWQVIKINAFISPGKYNELLKKVRDEYRVPWQHFIDLSNLISARYDDGLHFLPRHFNKETQHQKIINALNYFHNFMALDYPSNNLNTMNALWFKMAYTIYTKQIDEIGKQIQEFQKETFQKRSVELKKLLPEPMEQEEFLNCMKELFDLMIDHISENAPSLIKGFSGFFNSFAELQPNIRQKLPLNAQQATPETSKPQQAAPETSKPQQTAPKQRKQNESIKDLEEVWKDLIKTYDMREFSNPNTAFAIFHDYEILFFMGVLNKEEYEFCKKYRQKIQPINRNEREEEYYNLMQIIDKERTPDIIDELINNRIKDHIGDYKKNYGKDDDDDDDDDDDKDDFYDDYAKDDDDDDDDKDEDDREDYDKDEDDREDYDKDEDEIGDISEYETEMVCEERTMSELFDVILNSPETGNCVLPLKKEYIDAAKQLRLAGTVAYNLCDNMALPKDLEPYETYSTVQEVEGHFLLGLITIAKNLPVHQGIMNKLTLLSDGYWTQSVLQLNELPVYTKRPEMEKRIKKCAARLNNLPKNNLTSFSKRRQVYVKLLPEMDKAIAMQMPNTPQNKYAEYHKDWDRFQKYIKVFGEKYLKISDEEYMKQMMKDLAKKNERV